MKYAMSFVGLLLAVPGGTLIASHSRSIRELLFALLVFAAAQSGYRGLQVRVVALHRGIAPLQTGVVSLRMEDVCVQLGPGALQMGFGSV